MKTLFVAALFALTPFANAAPALNGVYCMIEDSAIDNEDGLFDVTVEANELRPGTDDELEKIVELPGRPGFFLKIWSYPGVGPKQTIDLRLFQGKEKIEQDDGFGWSTGYGKTVLGAKVDRRYGKLLPLWRQAGVGDRDNGIPGGGKDPRSKAKSRPDFPKILKIFRPFQQVAQNTYLKDSKAQIQAAAGAQSTQT